MGTHSSWQALWGPEQAGPLQDLLQLLSPIIQTPAHYWILSLKLANLNLHTVQLTLEQWSGGLRVWTCWAVKIPDNLQFTLQIHCSASMDSTSLWAGSTVVFTIGKKPHVSGPIQFKSMWFKGQLYLSRYERPLRKSLIPLTLWIIYFALLLSPGHASAMVRWMCSNFTAIFYWLPGQVCNFPSEADSGFFSLSHFLLSLGNCHVNVDSELVHSFI